MTAKGKTKGSAGIFSTTSTIVRLSMLLWAQRTGRLLRFLLLCNQKYGLGDVVTVKGSLSDVWCL